MAKFRETVRLFALDIEVTKRDIITGISRRAINKIITQIRQRITDCSEIQRHFESGEIEIDESYFGACRVLGIRDCEHTASTMSLDCSSTAARSIPRLSRTALQAN